MADSGAAGPENPFANRWFILSAAVLALVLVVGGIVFFVAPSTTSTPAASQPSQTAAAGTPTATPADPDASICGLPAGDQTVPYKTAPQTRWETVYTDVAAPTAPQSIGPGTVSDTGVRSCFAHSPTGALYAAANVEALGIAGRMMDVYTSLATGPGVAGMIASNPAPETTDVQIAIGGYQFVSYSDQSAIITLGFTVSNGTYVSQLLTLQWTNGDWKQVISEGGLGVFQHPTNLNDFVGWAGV